LELHSFLTLPIYPLGITLISITEEAGWAPEPDVFEERK
jgi:hypothetical protein